MNNFYKLNRKFQLSPLCTTYIITSSNEHGTCTNYTLSNIIIDSYEYDQTVQETFSINSLLECCGDRLKFKILKPFVFSQCTRNIKCLLGSTLKCGVVSSVLFKETEHYSLKQKTYRSRCGVPQWNSCSEIILEKMSGGQRRVIPFLSTILDQTIPTFDLKSAVVKEIYK